MHWTHPFFMAQIIQIAVILVLIKGFFVTSRAIKHLEDKFKTSLILMLLSFVFYILLAIAFSTLVYRQTSYDSYLWLIPPTIGLVGSIGLVFGGRKLLHAIEVE